MRKLSLLSMLLGAAALLAPAAWSARKGAPPPAASTAGRAEVIGLWRFEHDVKPEARLAVLGPVKRLDGAEFFYSEAVPARFTYDPVQKLSYPNTTSLNFQSQEGHNDALEIPLDAAKAGLPGQSVTLEMFFKPDAEWEAPLAMKSRLNDTATEWGLEAKFFPQFQQTYLHAFFTAPGRQTEHFRGGHLGTSAQIHRDDLGWRHMALVCDVAAGTLTCYIDYYQVKTIPMPGEMRWDAGPFYIGGGPERAAFGGQIDEVRLTKGALRPAQFLRAREEPIAGVSFETSETVLPRDSGYIDFKESFGAAGDGKTDDTAAFQEAFRVLPDRAPLTHHTLYIAPGTYLVSATLQSSRVFTVQGAGKDKTIIKLRDECTGFGQSANPRPVWRASSTPGAPGSNPEANGNSTANSIYDLTIDTGRGNPGAKGLEYHSNNVGRLENVQIRSGDLGGPIGLDLTHKTNGPALIKNVSIKGFEYGVSTAWQEYSMTFEHLTVEGQRTAGIKNNGNILAIRGLRSLNRVPALISEGANSMVTLLDSVLTSGDAVMPPPPKPTRGRRTPAKVAKPPEIKESVAIQSDGGLYVLRVETPGYKTAIRKRVMVDAKAHDWKDEILAGPKIDEYIGDQIVTGHGRPSGALKLPIEETPQVPWGDIQEDWVNVQDFEDHKPGTDWAPAIQAALEYGAKTLYFPPGRYEVASPIRLNGSVERLFGLHSRITRSEDFPAGEPAVIYDETDAGRTLSIERLDIESLRHASPATLVLKSSTPGRYTNAAGCGKLFLEDLGGEFRFEHPQLVWVRQWNVESHEAGPCIFSRGATIWCLGFKTEHESSKLWAEAGAQTEILGAFIYPMGQIPEDRPIFKNADSKMAIIYGSTVNRANHQVHILDSQGPDTKTIGNDQLKWVGTRGRMDLYTSDATGPASGN